MGYWSQFVDFVLYIFGPLCRCLRFVEGLPWNGFSYFHGEGVSRVLIHLIDQEKHGDIHLLHQSVADIGEAIEEVAVATAEMDGYHIALILYTLGNERLLPWQIANLTLTAT